MAFVESSPKVSSKDMKMEDLNEFSNIFASLFNNSDIHDRVLCFEVIRDEESEKKVDETIEMPLPYSNTFPPMPPPGPFQFKMDKKNERDGKKRCLVRFLCCTLEDLRKLNRKVNVSCAGNM